MNYMQPKYVVPIVGAFGDGRDFCKEEAYPMLGYLNREFTPKFIDTMVARYLEYGLLSGHRNGKIPGHLYIKITRKGEACLDFYRNMNEKSLDRDPDQLEKYRGEKNGELVV